jgi:hypothetical protein
MCIDAALAPHSPSKTGVNALMLGRGQHQRLNELAWVRGTLHAHGLRRVPLTPPVLAELSALPSPRSRGEGIMTIAALAAENEDSIVARWD